MPEQTPLSAAPLVLVRGVSLAVPGCHRHPLPLNVDEPWPLAGSTEDLESAWLPVLSGLVKHLERGPVSPSERAR